MSLELDSKYDNALAFAWKPKCQRFAIIQEDGPTIDTSFYAMKTTRNAGGQLRKLMILRGKQADRCLVLVPS